MGNIFSVLGVDPHTFCWYYVFRTTTKKWCFLIFVSPKCAVPFGFCLFSPFTTPSSFREKDLPLFLSMSLYYKCSEAHPLLFPRTLLFQFSLNWILKTTKIPWTLKLQFPFNRTYTEVYFTSTFQSFIFSL